MMGFNLLLKKNIKRVSVYSIVLFLFVIFSISTLFQSLLPFSINRIIAFSIVITLIIRIAKHPTKKQVFLIAYMVLVLLVNTFFSREMDIALKDSIYYCSTLLILKFISDKRVIRALKVAFNDYRVLVKYVVYFIYIVNIMCLFIPGTYAKGWGGLYYIGFAGSAHTMASSLCLLLSIMILVFQKDNFSYLKLFMITSIIYLIFETGSRTFLVPGIILVSLYIQNKVKERFFKSIIVIILTLAVGYLFLNSNMYEKFLWSSVASNQGVESSLISSTGGRAAFWRIDIEAFKSSNFHNVLFGHTFDYVYLVNQEKYHMHIWAHNDIIDLLLSTGVIGTLLYCIYWKKYIGMILNENLKKKNIFIIVMYCIYIFFPMIINGMFTYQHLFYSTIFFGMFITERTYNDF